MNISVRAEAKTKYRRNVEAIHTLQQIEADGRYATQEEQQIPFPVRGMGRACGCI